MDINNSPKLTVEHIDKCFEAIKRVHPSAEMKEVGVDLYRIICNYTVDFDIQLNVKWRFELKGKLRELPYRVEISKRYDGIEESTVQGVYYDIVEIVMEVLVKHFR